MRPVPVPALAAAACAAALLAGCPLPQPLPEYSRGTVTPPRIVMDGIARPETIVQVPAGCATAPTYPLSATLIDSNTAEPITARWFVDYDPQLQSLCDPSDQAVIPAGTGGDPTRREVPVFRFAPYGYPSPLGGAPGSSAGVVHVVELVVSNNFDPAADQIALCEQGTTARPFRTPASETSGVRFETQAYRWVFLTVPEGGSVTCPAP